MVNAGDVEKSSRYSYKLIKMLGRGSYGQVWLAKRNDGRDVAIKVYYGGDEQVIKNMEEELKALKEISRVCSPYAVCVLDSYYAGGAPRIVMEFVQGAPLSKYMRGISLDQRQGRNDIIQNLLYGLQALHAAGATHQDIKEENIMWDERIQMPRYVDWGLACLRQYCEHRPACVLPCGSSGTAYTAPPELVIGAFNEQNFDMAKAHDIWSIGVVLADWFLMPPDKNVCMFYTAGCRELNEHAPRNQSPEQIQKWIDSISNPLAKQVLPLLLAQNWEARLKSWPTVMSIIGAQPQPEPVEVLQELLTPPQYNTLLDNFKKNAQLLASLQPGSYYLRFSSQAPGITVVVNDPERGIQRIGFRPNPADRSWTHMGKSWKKWYELVQYILSSLPGKDYTEISPIPLEQALVAKDPVTLRRQAAAEREVKRQQLLQKALQEEQWQGGAVLFSNPAQCHPDVDHNTGQAWRDFLKNPANQLKDIIAIPGMMPDTFWCFTKDDIIRSASFDPILGTFINPYTGKTLILAKSDKEALINYMMRSALVQRQQK